MATLATLVVKLTADAGSFFDEMQKAESGTSRLLGGIGKSTQTLGKVAMGGMSVVAGAVAGAGVAMANLAVNAAPIQGVADSFEGLAESADRGADDMLAALQRGNAGMIANRDLMMTFNKAAGLVSTDFAVQLPEAMQYLSKVSASTGQDMGFMLDSLVMGVGRLSPMILDNLNIQASLAEATERAADMFGVQASELTKTQTQAGMMAVVMEKLAANTAAMPDVAGTAAAGIAQMRAQFQNLEDQAGMALLPALNTLLGTFGRLTGVVLPPLVQFIEGTLAPALQTGAQFVNWFVEAILSGQGPVEALQLALRAIGLDEIAQMVGNLAAGVQNLWATVQPYVSAIAGWIGEHVQLKDVLIALGIAIASVLIPALYSVVTAVAPIIAVGLALIGVVALIRSAWESNFLGIRDIAAVVQAKLQELWSKATEFWNSFWSGFEPALDRMYGRLQEFWARIQPALVRAWQALNDLWNVVVGIWQNTLQPALDRLINALGLGGDKTSDFGSKVGALVGLLLEVQLESILNAIVVAVEAFAAAVNAVASAMEWWDNLISSVAAGLDGLKLPSWLDPGSPTPLEVGIRGISEAMRDLNLGGLSLAGDRGGMIVLAPVFLDPREYVMAGGGIDYARVGQRLRELEQGL